MPRIIVIDDESETRALMEQILVSAGYEVVLAGDGTQGLAQHRTHPADLVITDLFMPVQDGFETIRELRSHCPRVPIVAMSGRPDSGTMRSIAQNLAADVILAKPFMPDELLAAVTRALARP
jgi:DNA-binding response OmpR family regulator